MWSLAGSASQGHSTGSLARSRANARKQALPSLSLSGAAQLPESSSARTSSGISSIEQCTMKSSLFSAVLACFLGIVCSIFFKHDPKKMEPDHGIGGGFLYVLMGVMLVSGSFNTLLAKFQVRTLVPEHAGGEAVGFKHPVTQTLFMLLGECLCLLAYYYSRLRSNLPEPKFPKLTLCVPAIFDLSASTLIHAAYIFIPASVAQMTRGSIVVFTCLASVFVLGRAQHGYHYAGVALVAIGITVVALDSIYMPSADGKSHSSASEGAMVGVGLCILAQVLHASMLVYEESVLNRYSIPPLLAVGVEGVFGCAFVVVALSVLNELGIENTRGAMYQLGSSAPLLLAVLGFVVSIAFFNWSGISVTINSSCVARATIDCARTILIWGAEMALGWSSFRVWQLVGFVVLAAGTLLYNRIVEIHTLFTYPQLPAAAASPEDKGLGGKVSGAGGTSSKAFAAGQSSGVDHARSQEDDPECQSALDEPERPLLAGGGRPSVVVGN